MSLFHNPNRIIFSVLLLIIALGLTHCDYANRRYEEGPVLSIYSAEDRVTNTWNWAYLLENDENISGVYQDSTITFEEGGEVKICGGENCRTGTWQLISKKNQLQIIFGQKAIAYEIQLLKKNEIWLSYEDTVADFSTEWQLVEEE